MLSLCIIFWIGYLLYITSCYGRRMWLWPSTSTCSRKWRSRTLFEKNKVNTWHSTDSCTRWCMMSMKVYISYYLVLPLQLTVYKPWGGCAGVTVDCWEALKEWHVVARSCWQTQDCCSVLITLNTFIGGQVRAQAFGLLHVGLQYQEDLHVEWSIHSDICV